jgi:hypothetical protein
MNHILAERLRPTSLVGPVEDALARIGSKYASHAALIQGCLDQGTWTLTDDELVLITGGITAPSTSPLFDPTPSDVQPPPGIPCPTDKASEDLTEVELRAISRCFKEQGYRREAARATRSLQRHRLVQRRYLELRQDSIHKNNPTSEYVLKKRAFEQIMDETTYQKHFPLAPTNDSLSQNIQNFAIEAQCKPYHDIGTWGFAVLRLDYDDDAAWDKYKKLIEAGAQKLLLGNNVTQQICSQFRFTYLEDPSALSGPVDQVKLVKYWEKRQWNEDVHLDINRQFFLSVDELTRKDENPNDPPMNIHDASVDEIEKDSFPGYRKTSIYELILWHIAGIENSRLHLRTIWEMVNS